MNNLTSSAYSWSLLCWWNLCGTYKRIQYNSEEICTHIWSVTQIVEQGISYLLDSAENTRLDIRLIIHPDVVKDIPMLRTLFWDMDMSLKQYEQEEYLHLIIWKNKLERVLDEQVVQDIQFYTRNKVCSTIDLLEDMWGFEKFAISELNKIKKRGFYFVKDNFTIEEVHELWGKTFWWEKENIANLLSNSWQSAYLYGLRNSIHELISLVLISDWETTEWATRSDYQWRKLIEPLLIFANSDFISTNGKQNTRLYVHARYNRSISPSVKSGMRFCFRDDLPHLLTNHVEIDWEYQTFVEWVLDSSLYTDKIFDEYLSSNS